MWRRWDGNAAIFDDATGDTHILDALAGEVLGRVNNGIVSAESLSRDLAADLDLPADETFRATVRRTLERFAALGFVEEMPT
ncbi:MAG: HPr-rel-A system PqqD family peptide chaperone [Alphaproteobacteria bacterium]